MYETILAPMDGSKRAEAILPHLEKLAFRNGAGVIFMQAIEPVFMGGGARSTLQIISENKVSGRKAKDYLSGLKRKFCEKGISARIFVTHGPVVEAITNTAETEKADIIAIASHGRTGLGRVFYGSIAAGVLHRIDRPLLLIRSARPYNSKSPGEQPVDGAY